MTTPIVVFDHEDYIRPAHIELHARLWWCALHGHVDKIMDLNPWSGPQMHLVNMRGASALHNAALHPRLFTTTDVMQLCVAAGTDVHATDHEQRTPLHVAASKGNFAAIEQLSAHGARWDVVSALGHSPLSSFLLSAPNYIDRNDIPLFQQIVRWCIEQGADPNQRCAAQDGTIRTPLGSMKSLEALVSFMQKNPRLNPEYVDLVAWFEEVCVERSRQSLQHAIEHVDGLSRAKPKI